MRFKNITYPILFSFVAFTGCTEMSKEEESEKPKQVIKKDKPLKKPTISVSEKKQRFIDTLVPISTKVYNELELQYQMIKNDIKEKKNSKEIDRLRKKYKANTDELLLQALKPHPISILLAQAAAESAWLTSRFTKDANNIFGVWSFNKNEPRIAASGLRGDKTIYLKKYKSLEDAVRDYYKNLAKNWAYKEFRKERIFTDNPYILSNYLGSYSEKKEVYTELLKSMIKYNKFEKYDIKSDLEIKKIDINTTILDNNQTIINDINVTNEIIPKEVISIDTNVTTFEDNQTSAKDINISENIIPTIEINEVTQVDTNTAFLENNKTIIMDINSTMKLKGLNN
jgi:Bax protein